MNLQNIVERRTPQPWEEGDNIPWNDPAFSARMLAEHLSQEHDAASRRQTVIDQHVAWIHGQLLNEKPGRVLDLGCGPGLYASRLAQLGHICHGIDFSPASIQYARDTAEREVLACTYTLSDLRQADYGDDYDLVMLIFGEFNVFRPADAELILQKAYAALRPGGLLLLEPHTYAYIERLGKQAPRWWTSGGGLFSDRPHLMLTENFWHANAHAATVRHYVVTAEDGSVTRYAQTFQAYDSLGYRSILEDHGFEGLVFYAALGSSPGDPRGDLIGLSANKPQGAA